MRFCGLVKYLRLLLSEMIVLQYIFILLARRRDVVYCEGMIVL
jgi:hypothetical protein